MSKPNQIQSRARLSQVALRSAGLLFLSCGVLLAQEPPTVPPGGNPGEANNQYQAPTPIVIPVPTEVPVPTEEMGTNEADMVEAPATANGGVPGNGLVPGDGMASAADPNGGPARTNEPLRPIVRDPQSWRSRRTRPSQSGSNGYIANLASTNINPATFESFTMIAQRNIFNPNRYPANGPRQQRQDQPVRPPREFVALVGTMSYEKGDYAFFAGSSSAYNTSLRPGGRIADYKILAVTPTSVKLAQQTNVFELKIGMQLRRDEDGPWLLGAEPATLTAAAAPGASNATGTTVPSTSFAPAGADSDIIKRLMQRREQE